MKDKNFSKKQILPQMFDIRPTDKSGYLELEKIEKLERVVKIFRNKDIDDVPKKIKKMEDLRKPSIFDDEVKRFYTALEEEKKTARKEKRNIIINENDVENVKKISVEFEAYKRKDDLLEEEFNVDNIFTADNKKDCENKNTKESFFVLINEKVRKKIFNLGKFSLASAMLIFLFIFTSNVIKIKNEGLVKGQEAFTELAAAKESVRSGNFDQSYVQFDNAYEKLNQVSKDLNGIGGILIDSTKYLPYLSRVSSGKHLIIAGKDISQSGVLTMEVLKTIEEIKSGKNKESPVSYLAIFQDSQEKLKQIYGLLQEAQSNLEEVNTDDVPQEEKDKLIEIKKNLPEITNSLKGFLSQEKVLVDILGGNGPRKYLFLFQNNQEMRATGGFIGSYALLDIFNGRVRNFFIDGIFNPDGQLKDKIVPPAPIQKISAAWSLHDSNWFPDFPVSAEKAISFYEKTGGPTADGVITMTPTVIQKMLEITGPIEMPEYNLTVDKDNFIEKVQNEVEVDYDKELNQPKKILSDLAPKVLDRIFNSNNFSDLSKVANVLLKSLNEKQILIYSKNWDIEKMLSQNGWSGEILSTPKDYLNVINTNINGFKTDGVIDESITHDTNIQEDGTIIDTLTINRKHNGGDTPYEWWNKVNADYMRVYVPKGSQLISVEGQTREFNSPPLDYDALGFKRDPQVQMEEDAISIDDESGTKIYTDSEKTVFANWVYVSPKENVTIKYIYALPFKINMDNQHPTGTYSLLVQKQSGSLGSNLSINIKYPEIYKIVWQYPDDINSQMNDLPNSQAGIKIDTNLKTNKFFGLAFGEK